MLKHILVPVDGSEAAQKAARFAAGLAVAEDAQLTLLYVVELSSSQAMGLVGVTAADFDARIAGAGTPVFEAIAAEMGVFSTPIKLHERVEIGFPADEILRVARQLDVDLIVMGSRGLGPVPQILLGSVGEKVVRRAHCPVTIVR